MNPRSSELLLLLLLLLRRRRRRRHRCIGQQGNHGRNSNFFQSSTAFSLG